MADLIEKITPVKPKAKKPKSTPKKRKPIEKSRKSNSLVDIECTFNECYYKADTPQPHFVFSGKITNACKINLRLISAWVINEANSKWAGIQITATESPLKIEDCIVRYHQALSAKKAEIYGLDPDKFYLKVRVISEGNTIERVITKKIPNYTFDLPVTISLSNPED